MPKVFDSNDSTLVVTAIETFDPDCWPIISLGLTLSNGETAKFDDGSTVDSMY